MKEINVTLGIHDWTRLDGPDKYGVDRYQCKRCKMIGYRVGFSSIIRVDQPTDDYLINNCTIPDQMKYRQHETQLRIFHCAKADQPAYANITPQSVHHIIDPPEGERNWDNGVWVMGVGKPVKLLYREFFVEPILARPKMTRIAPKPIVEIPKMARIKKPEPAPKMARLK